jgi:hypothetical protein
MINSRLSTRPFARPREENLVSAADALLNMAIERQYLEDICSALLVPHQTQGCHLSIQIRAQGDSNFSWVNIYGDGSYLLSKLDKTVGVVLESGTPAHPEALQDWQKQIAAFHKTPGESLVLKIA